MNPIVVFALLNKKIKDVNKRIDDMGSGMSYQGSVQSKTDLPNDADVGDTYTVIDEGNAMYLWDGTEWIEQNSGIYDSVAAIIASNYDNTATYDVGDYAVYQKKLYKCSTEISVPEDWTAAHWTETDIATEIEGLEASKISATEKGVANGVATLDANTKIPEEQIPDKFDDVVYGYYDATTTHKFYKENTYTTEITAVVGKLYVTQDTHICYSYTGNDFVKVGSGLSLGETENDAYRGDRGKTAYDDSQTNKEHIGDLESLETTAQSSLVGAINEIVGDISDIETEIADVTDAEIDDLF